jgi:hypothetical protein
MRAAQCVTGSGRLLKPAHATVRSVNTSANASASAINTFMVLGSLMLTGDQDPLCSFTKPQVHALPASRG